MKTIPKKNFSLTKSKGKQLGQGMTEYIIIVALIAIAAIAVFRLFGDTARNQVAAMAQELGGGNGDTARGRANTAAGNADNEEVTNRSLNDYTGNNEDN